MTRNLKPIWKIGLMAGLWAAVSLWRQRPGHPRPGHPGTALITGASSGIGAAFARTLAAEGYDLLLVARRAERLAALAAELRQQHGVTVETLAVDLATPAGIAQVAQRITHLPNLTLLINNAGFGLKGPFWDVDLARQQAMIQLHVQATVALCHAALPGMLAHRHGQIINVSSVAAFGPLPGNATYMPTKAYLNNFSESLALELQGRGVQVQALCPGFTYSEFHDTAEYAGFNRRRYPGFMWMTAEAVAAHSLAALRRAQPPVVFVPGRVNRLLTLIQRSRLPRPFLRQIVRLMGPSAARP